MTVVVSLGSNVGDRLAHLRAGLDVLSQRFGLCALSSVYETAPVGVTDQPAFLNCVAVLDTTDAAAVFDAGQQAEEMRGRIRSRRWGPRPLDVDVIAADGLVCADQRLTLPHPRAHERAFVLVPWLEVDPTADLPGYGPVRTLLQQVPGDGVRRWER